MIVETFSLTKLLGGFAFWQGPKIGKIIFYAVICIIALGVYHKIFFARSVVTNQKTIIQRADNVSVKTGSQDSGKEDNIFLGVKLWRLKLGLRI